MREILFRGKSIDDGRFVYGYVGVFKGTTQIYVPFTEEEEKENEGHIFSHIGGLWYTVQPETVGQFTGLTDKNGKKIFEGDILSTENGTFSNTGMGHILLYKGMWTSFYGQDAIGRDCFDELHTVCGSREVIGNIHDNPELLEGKE